MPTVLWALVVLTVTSSIVSASNSDNEVSYTFVIDTTGSMSEEILEVQDGVKKILDAAPSKIKNYTIVPFNDPFNPSKIVTSKDKDEIIRALDDLRASGGGECPEPGFEALLKAIEKSKEKSPIFYFSDAEPSRPSLWEDVVTKIAEKEIKMFFLLTGCCSSCGASNHQKYTSVVKKAGKRLYQLLKRTNVKYWMRLLTKLAVRNKPAAIEYAPEKFEDIVVPLDKGEMPASISAQGRAAGLTAAKGLVLATAAVAAVWTMFRY